MAYMENMHRNVADQLLSEDPRPLRVLPSHPSSQSTAPTMFGFPSRWARKLYSAAETRGGYGGARGSRERFLAVDSEEYKQLMDRSNDEVDVLAIRPMLSEPSPMTWTTYCDVFVSAIESTNEVFYPNMYKRYRELTKAYEEKLITWEQYNKEPLVYAVKNTSSKYIAKIL